MKDDLMLKLKEAVIKQLIYDTFVKSIHQMVGMYSSEISSRDSVQPTGNCMKEILDISQNFYLLGNENEWYPIKNATLEELVNTFLIVNFVKSVSYLFYKEKVSANYRRINKIHFHLTAKEFIYEPSNFLETDDIDLYTEIKQYVIEMLAYNYLQGIFIKRYPNYPVPSKYSKYIDELIEIAPSIANSLINDTYKKDIINFIKLIKKDLKMPTSVNLPYRHKFIKWHQFIINEETVYLGLIIESYGNRTLHKVRCDIGIKDEKGNCWTFRSDININIIYYYPISLIGEVMNKVMKFLPSLEVPY